MGVQNSFKFRNFYDYTNFNSEKSLAITKAILELISPIRDSNLAECKAWKEGRKFEDTNVTFSESDTLGLPRYHNRALYIPAYRRRAKASNGGHRVLTEYYSFIHPRDSASGSAQDCKVAYQSLRFRRCILIHPRSHPRTDCRTDKDDE